MLPKVTVIIVNFNAGEFLLESAGAALASTTPIELIVVDNHSTDGSIEKLKAAFPGRGIKYIENRQNLGFAKANNQAINVSSCDYILCLNPDCVVKPDTLERVVAEMEARPAIGMASCFIENPDGTEQPGCRRMMPSPFRSMVRTLKLGSIVPSLQKWCVNLDKQPLPDEPVEVEAVSGAFMMIKKETLDRVGLLDEAYFMHCEDLDLCIRLRYEGIGILFIPNVRIMHHKGVCSSSRLVRVEFYKHKGMMHFYNVHFRKLYGPLLMFFVMLAVWLRFSLKAVQYTILNISRWKR